MERKGWGRRRKKQENGNGAATELLLQNKRGSFGRQKREEMCCKNYVRQNGNIVF